MNQILLFKEDFIDESTVLLKGRRFEHIIKFLAKSNSKLKIGILGGNSGVGEIVSQNRNSLKLSVSLNVSPLEAMDVTLILAMPRPKVLRRIIQHGTSLGIKKFFIIKTWGVGKSYWSTPLLKENSLFLDMILGLEQSCDTILPEIQIRKFFKPFVEDELPNLVKGKTAIVAHPENTDTSNSIASIRSIENKKIVFAIGPESGFTSYEIEMFLKQGFYTVSLGERILRVETAIPFLMGKIII